MDVNWITRERNRNYRNVYETEDNTTYEENNIIFFQVNRDFPQIYNSTFLLYKH
jgi:hypothetical protein